MRAPEGIAMPTKSSAGPEDLTAETPTEKNGVSHTRQGPAPERVTEIAEAIAALVDAGGCAIPAHIARPRRHEQTAAKANGRADARLRIVNSPRAFGSKAAPRKQGHAWFEARFDELRGAVERLASANSSARTDEIAALNAHLDDLMKRLDGALEAQSHEDAFKSLKCQLVGLAGYLEHTKEWAEAGHAKIEARLDGVEGRLGAIDQSLACSQKAILNIPEQTSAQISEAIRRIPIPQGLGRIERDVRALSMAARENEEHTAEAISELHGALQMILNQLASMGEKLSVAGEAADETRDRDRAAPSVEEPKSNVEPFVIPSAAANSSAPGKIGKRYAASGGQRQQRGSRLALVSAITILALTGVAMFAHHFRDPKSNELMAGGPWQSPPTQSLANAQPPLTAQRNAPAQPRAANTRTADASPNPMVAKAEPTNSTATEGSPAFRSVSAPRATSELWVARTEQPPVAPAANSPDGAVPPSGQEWRGVESVALPLSIGSERVRIAAIAGDPGAQFVVANCYELGQGVARDPSAAARWFRRASEQKHAPSQYRLATLYERGHGVEKNLAEAESLYLRSSNIGNVKAMHNLAVLLIHKQGEIPDYQVAARWFMNAAEYGFTDSQYNLAILYEQGLGVSRDPAMAYKWFSLSARGGDLQAATQRDRLVGRLSTEDTARLTAEITAWRAKPVDETANQVPTSQEQAESGQSPSNPATGLKPFELKVIETMPTPRRLKRRSQRSSASGKWLANGEPVPEQEPRPKAQMAVAVVNSRNIAAQAGLSELGYEIGPRDGQMGPKTREAIKQFQRDHGLAVTGGVTDALLVKLAFAQNNS
jgi:hypothetical protein